VSLAVSSMDRSRWMALAVLCAGSLMIIIDQTIVTVALPSIKSALGFSESGLAWVVNAYTVPFGGLLLLAGRLGDLLGRKRMFVSGMVIFTGASLVCGLAGTVPMLIGARFVQGIGGAMSSAVLLGIIVPLFPLRADRAKALGMFSFVQSAGGALGSLLGGVLTQAISWHWIFFINVPIGTMTVGAAIWLLAADRGAGLAAGADAVGGVLVTGGLMLAVYSIVEVSRYGLLSAHTLRSGALAIVLLAGFVVREATAAKPLLPLRTFRSRNVSSANGVQALLVAGLFGFMFITVLYLRQSVQYDPLETGLAMVPVAIAIGAVSLLLSARLNTRFGERPVLLAGLAPIAAGLVLLGRAPADAVFVVDVLPAMLLIGAGFGMAMPALMALGMSGATAEDSGLASGLFSTSQQVGGALGLAVLVTLAAARTGQAKAGGLATIPALTSGYHVAFLGAAATAVAALIIAAIALKRPRALDQCGPADAAETGQTRTASRS